MVVGGNSLSSGGCPSCMTSQRSVETWMHHLAECHPLPDEWLSEKVCRLSGEAAQRPYTFTTESKKKRKKDYIPRPLNSFMIFARHMRRSILEIFSEASNSDISKQLGEVWRTLAPVVKAQYNNEATKLAKIHLREFPNYKYQPKKKIKAGAVGTHSNNMAASSSGPSTAQQHNPPTQHHNNTNQHSHNSNQQYQIMNGHQYSNNNHSHNLYNQPSLNGHQTQHQQHTMPRLAPASIVPRGVQVSMIPLSVKTENIDGSGRRWMTYQLSASPAMVRPGSSSVSINGELPSPASGHTPMISTNINNSTANLTLQQLAASSGDSAGPPSDVALDTNVASSNTHGSCNPVTVSTGVASCPSDVSTLQHSLPISNCDYFAHLMDCSGFSGFNLETLTFGDLPPTSLADEPGSFCASAGEPEGGSLAGLQLNKFEEDFNDFKVVVKEEKQQLYSSQTPSSVLSDDMLNLLPSSAFSGSSDDGVFGFDSQLGLNDSLPNLVSWVGSRM